MENDKPQTDSIETSAAPEEEKEYVVEQFDGSMSWREWWATRRQEWFGDDDEAGAGADFFRSTFGGFLTCIRHNRWLCVALLAFLLLQLGYALVCNSSGHVYGLHIEMMSDDAALYYGPAPNLPWFRSVAIGVAVAATLLSGAIVIRGTGRSDRPLGFMSIWLIMLFVTAMVSWGVYTLADAIKITGQHAASAAGELYIVTVGPYYVLKTAWYAMLFGGVLAMVFALVFSALYKNKGSFMLAISAGIASVAVLVPIFFLAFVVIDILNFVASYDVMTLSSITVAYKIALYSLILAGIASLTRRLLTSRPTPEE